MVQDKTIPQEPRSYRFSVQEFLRMSELGLFESSHRLQLIKGEIIEVEVMGPSHFNAIVNLDRRLQGFQDEVLVSPQCPLVLPDSAPFPDFALLQLPQEQYKGRLPTFKDVLLVIEISDSTLNYDRTKKLAMYAEVGISEYWIVNVVDNQLEIYRDPKGSDYQTRTTLQPGTPAQALCLSQPVEWS